MKFIILSKKCQIPAFFQYDYNFNYLHLYNEEIKNNNFVVNEPWSAI